MRSYQVKKSINAEPAVIWALLTDAAGYPKWNAAVDRIEGTIAPDQTIKVHVPVNPGRAFPVKVTTFKPPRRWCGRAECRLASSKESGRTRSRQAPMVRSSPCRRSTAARWRE